MPDKQNIEHAILGGILGIGTAAIISLLFFQNVTLFLIDGVIAAAVYLFGYQNVKQGNLDTAKTTLLGGAIVTGLGAAISSLLHGRFMALLVASPIVGLWLYAFSKLSEQTSPAQSSAQSSPGGATPDVVEQIRQLGELLNAGLITKEEFEAKKTELLSRI